MTDPVKLSTAAYVRQAISTVSYERQTVSKLALMIFLESDELARLSYGCVYDYLSIKVTVYRFVFYSRPCLSEASSF